MAWRTSGRIELLGNRHSIIFPSKYGQGWWCVSSRNLSVASMHYSDPMGSRDLREAVATYLRTARGVCCEAEQIMIVSGSQLALEIATRVLLDRGSRVWMEEPGYQFARNVFALNGCRIIPVPVDEEGLNVGAGIRRCRNARAVLVTPSHQYPTGVTMSASRRLQLLDWAQKTGSWIIEDTTTTVNFVLTVCRSQASLQGLDRGSQVVYIGTFSKVLFPSLRLGYLGIPPDLIDRFLSVRLTIDIGPRTFLRRRCSPTSFGRGTFPGTFGGCDCYIASAGVPHSRASKRTWGLPVDVAGEQAGLHLSLTLPPGLRDQEISERASRHGLLARSAVHLLRGTSSSAGIHSGVQQHARVGNTARSKEDEQNSALDVTCPRCSRICASPCCDWL